MLELAKVEAQTDDLDSFFQAIRPLTFTIINELLGERSREVRVPPSEYFSIIDYTEEVELINTLDNPEVD